MYLCTCHGFGRILPPRNPSICSVLGLKIVLGLATSQGIMTFLREKVGFKLNIQKMKIMASGPITSWEIDGETVETMSDFIFWGSKITADCDCSHEIKSCLLLGRKVMTNLDSIFEKQRHYFANKGPSSQGYGFSSGHVWMSELDCEEG